MSFLDDDVPAQAVGFAEGWTAFPTVAGLDILLRTTAGESKGRLNVMAADGTLTGSMYEPGAAENAQPLQLSATLVSNDHVVLTCNKRTWQMHRPKGKQHLFAFLNQWPAKAEPAADIKAMLAAMKPKK